LSIATQESSLRGESIARPSSLVIPREFQPQSGRLGFRREVLGVFSRPVVASRLALEGFSARDWRNLVPWLHTSGLALYLLDRLEQLELVYLLPDDVKAQLRENLQDNSTRTAGMMSELAAIRRGFETHRLRYAVLKGCSLTPHSVPNLELRHQFDLDFLVAADRISDARHVLERQGYRLYAISGMSWEFKKDEKIGVGLRDFYKDQSGRTVELHLQSHQIEGRSLLDGVERRRFGAIEVSVLSPEDIFLGQALHAYKHLRGEFTRTSHVLEVYRHVQARRDDRAFWSRLRSRAEGNHEAALGLGVVTLLVMTVMNITAPRELTEWTVDSLPDAVKLWVRLYGDEVVFDDVPGSKLYLLLERALEPSGYKGTRSAWKALLPHRPPPLVIRSAGGESAAMRMRRYRLQVSYVLMRLRFHLVEGMRYGWEAWLWSKRVDGVKQ
jgi:Uncharacterised nucleotidyltransferase